MTVMQTWLEYREDIVDLLVSTLYIEFNVNLK